MPTVPLEDGTLWYEEHGDGPPLVCLHGGWHNSDAWRPQVEHFADEYRVVTFDLRGHGQTGATETRRYSIDLFVDDLERLLDRLDIDRPILCGISLGGMIVQSYLERHPKGARGAVIGGPVRSMPPVDLPPAMKAAFTPLPAVAGMAGTVGPRATFQSQLNAIRATTGRRWLSVDSSVRAKSMAAVDEVSSTEYPKIFRALYDATPPDISHVRTPTLVVYGDHEAPSVKRQGNRLAESVADGAIREFPDAGHLVNQDTPQAFNNACATFFDGLESPAG